MEETDTDAYQRWGRLSLAQLEDALRRLDLPIEGTSKDDLVKRLVDFERVTLRRKFYCIRVLCVMLLCCGFFFAHCISY